MTSVDRNRVTKASPIRFSNHRRRVLSTYSSDEIQLGEIYSLENINCFGDKRERTNKVDVKRRTDFLTSEMFALEFGIFKRINCSLGHKLNIDCLKVHENFCFVFVFVFMELDVDIVCLSNRINSVVDCFSSFLLNVTFLELQMNLMKKFK
jgi:hypothetical protein